MNNTLVLQIVIIAVILFVIVNYFISSSHDSKVIDNIIKKRRSEDEETEDFIYSMEKMKAVYLKEKFRIYVTRGIFFGAGLWFIIIYLTGQNKKGMIEYPIPRQGIVMCNDPINNINPININPTPSRFFERPNW